VTLYEKCCAVSRRQSLSPRPSGEREEHKRRACNF
jgi:hypothetical protein